MSTTLRPNPFQAIMTCGFGIYCAMALIVPRIGGHVLMHFPLLWGRVFLVGSILACVLTVAGAFGHSIYAVLFEQAGLYALTGLTLAYALWAIGVNGSGAIAFSLMLGSFGVAALLRALQIRGGLVTARRSIGADS
jgi:hypothetical protein